MTPFEERYPLEWIDEYVAAIKDYVAVREADNLLIKVPNEAHKLNDGGIILLKRLFGGDSVLDVLAEHGKNPAVRKDIYEFFIALKKILTGCIDENNLPPAVEKRAFALGFAKLPVLSEIALTYRCNLSCRFCYAGCNCTKSSGGSRESTTDEVKTMLDVIRRRAQVPSVSFTGGEPTLRRDLEDLIAHADAKLDMRVNLITNGTLIDEARAESLARAGLDSAQVSVEAPTAEIHDALTGVKGSFEKSVAAVELLAAKNIAVHTNTTINRLNIGCAAEMPAFAKGVGADRLSMNMVIPSGTSVAGDGGINLRYAEMPDVLLKIKSAAERAGVEFMWYSPTPVCIFNPVAHKLGNKGCSACDGLLSVSPLGDVLPCSSWAEPVGNILTEEFENVWESAAAKNLREKKFATAPCTDCADFALCQSGCPLYWKHFGAEELEKYGVKYAAAGCNQKR